MSTSSGSRVEITLALAFDGGPPSERVGDARLDPTRCRAGWHAHDERGGEDPHRRIEERVGRVQVTADDVGAFTAAAVPDDRKHAPRWGVHQVEHRHAICGRGTADVVPVPVGDDDDIAGTGPVAFAVVARDPARPARDDVEDDQALGAGMEHAGDRVRDRFEGEPFGPFGAEEDRPFEAELFERLLQRRGHGERGCRTTVRRRWIRGVSVSTRGAWVILAAGIPLHTRHDTNHRFCRPACTAPLDRMRMIRGNP